MPVVAVEMEKINMFQGSLQDRILIRERYGAYSDAVFRQDVDAWLANYSEEGVWEIHGKAHRGKTELRAKWESLWAMLDKMAFFTEIGAIAVEGDSASARSYCREIVSLKNGQTMKVVGFYEDELIRRNDNWLFSKRHYTPLLNESAPATA